MAVVEPEVAVEVPEVDVAEPEEPQEAVEEVLNLLVVNHLGKNDICLYINLYVRKIKFKYLIK